MSYWITNIITNSEFNLGPSINNITFIPSTPQGPYFGLDQLTSGKFRGGTENYLPNVQVENCGLGRLLVVIELTSHAIRTESVLPECSASFCTEFTVGGRKRFTVKLLLAMGELALPTIRTVSLLRIIFAELSFVLSSRLPWNMMGRCLRGRRARQRVLAVSGAVGHIPDFLLLDLLLNSFWQCGVHNKKWWRYSSE